MRRTALVAALAAAAAAAPPPQAHVTLQPNTAPPGAFTRLDVRVPNERDDASTTKVEVQLPDGFAAASYEPVPGWTVKVTTGPLDHADPDRRRRDHRGRQADHVDRRQRRGRHPARRLPGLRAVLPDPRQGRRQARVQGAPDLRRRRGRALDRRRGLRQPGRDRDRREPAGADAAAHGDGDAAAEATPAATAAATHDQRRRLRQRPRDRRADRRRLGLVAGAAGLLAARRRASGRSGAAA